jgi:hypothetical protein
MTSSKTAPGLSMASTWMRHPDGPGAVIQDARPDGPADKAGRAMVKFRLRRHGDEATGKTGMIRLLIAARAKRKAETPMLGQMLTGMF